jgi:peptidoglycan/LPS O-acetylase OafA/YrhL
MTLTNARKFFFKTSVVVAIVTFLYLVSKFGIIGFSIVNQKSPHWVAQLWFTALLIILLSVTFRQSNVFSNSASFSYTLFITHFPTFLFLFAIFHPLIGNEVIPLLLVSLFSVIIVIVLSYFIALKTEQKKLYEQWLLSLAKRDIFTKIWPAKR